VDTRTARMDLTFSLAERFTEAGEPAGISGAVEFRTDVFDAASIEALIERFERVVAAMTTEPTWRLSSIDVLDTAEHARLAELGQRAVLSAPVSAPLSIPQLFAAQVGAAPGATAISDAAGSMSYRQLDEVSNRLAHKLIAHGAGSGSVVGVLLNRSAQAVVA